MSLPDHLVLERPVLRPSFALAAVDDARARPVTEGLRVSVAPQAGAVQGLAREAVPSPGGAQVLHDRRSVGADGLTVRIEDQWARYLPTRLSVDAPRAVPGLDGPPCLPEGSAVPLFLRPDQPAPPGLATVRAALWHATAATPAAFALLRLREAGSGRLLGRGLADERGQVLAAVCLGEPVDADGGESPPQAQPAARRQWLLRVEVCFSPALVRHADPAFGPGTPPWPDLCALLSQPRVPAFAGSGSPPVPLELVVLRQGEPLILAADAGGLVVVHPA